MSRDARVLLAAACAWAAFSLLLLLFILAGRGC
jgi:hypothetical protein